MRTAVALPKLQHSFTVGLDALALEFDVDLDFESDWRDKGRQLVSGTVSMDAQWFDSLRDDDDREDSEAELLRLIGQRVGGKAKWVEGDWGPWRGRSGLVMTRHFVTDRKKVAPQNEAQESTMTLKNTVKDFRRLAGVKLTESTGLDCYFYKATDGKWYMALEDWHERQSHNHYGPFDSEDAALDYLDKNFANPGGYSSYDDGKQKPPKNPIKPTGHKSSYYAKAPWR